MFDQKSPFFERSKRIAEDFLQTTIVVDDQAYFEPAPESTVSSASTNLEDPPRRKSDISSDEDELAESDEPLLQVPEATGSHRLNAQEVINSFAQKRIVCSVIKPTKNDTNWITTVERLAASADIIVVDWELHKDNGEKALDILEQIIKSAIEFPAQLRLFAIYTGDPRIAQIADKVKTTLEERLQVNIEEQDKGFSLTFDSTRIIILAKPDTSHLPQQHEDRKVSFDNLAERVTSEFAVMTAGLVSNVAIKSLALVRKNTYKILNRFSIHLDAPYLTHRALQVNPEDAEEFLAALIAEELLTILEEGNVGSEANLDSIKDWLSSSGGSEFVLPLEKKPKTLSQDQVFDLLSIGIDAWDQASNKQKKNPHKLPLTEMFRFRALDSQDLDEKFGLVTTLRSSYEKREPRLMFGTIVQNVTDSGYWVCLQPRCDCVRIESDRAFPFLPLVISKGNQKFNLVLEEEEKHIRLRLNDKPYDLSLITFTPHPEGNGMIVAKYENSTYCFTDTNETKYKWIGELRPEHAQRVANEFATNLSRVGLDESEWLRLWATKG